MSIVPSSSLETEVLPTPFQVALALVIVRSKSSGTSVRDYILAIRKHIESAPDDETPTVQSELHLQFNSTAYWRGLCENAEGKEEALRNQVSYFERQNERLTLELEDLRSLTCPQGSDKKRKRGATLTVGRNTKRAKINDFMILDETALEKLDSNRITGRAGRTLLRHVFELSQLLQQDFPDINDTAWLIQKTCANIRETVAGICSPYLQQQPPPKVNPPKPLIPITKDDLNAASVALSRIIQLIASAYEKVMTSQQTPQNAARSKGAATHSLANLFRNLLTDLGSCIEHNVLHGVVQESRPTVSKIKARRTKTSSTSEAPDLAQDLPLHISYLVHAFLASSTSESWQAHLHEGLLSLIITRAGALLYTLTFATGPRAVDISGEIASSSIYRTSAALTAGATIDPDKASRIALHEARYLLPLVERMLPKHSIPASVTLDGVRDLSHSDLKKLQSTLVRGVFGIDDNGIFADVMRMPPAVELDTPAGRLDEAEGRMNEQDPDWFLARMWEVCGWDVLGQQPEGLGAE